jgi:hypothetical protein
VIGSCGATSPAKAKPVTDIAAEDRDPDLGAGLTQAGKSGGIGLAGTG